MNTTVTRASLLLTLALALFFTGNNAMSQTTDNHGIHVNGRGEVRIEPDIARFTLEVNRQGPDAVVLKKEMDSIMASVLKLTDKLKIARKDVTAASVQIHPNRVYHEGKQSIDGVIASRSIQVTLRNLDNIGTLMNRSLEIGINNIGGVQLDTSRRIELQEQALTLAIEDAKTQAAVVARGFDVTLGQVKDVHVSGQHAVRPQLARAAIAMDSAEESFSPGEMTINRDIQATFTIVSPHAN